MGTINYTLVSGALPITVSLIGSGLSDNVHASYGDFSFTSIPPGDYYMHIVDNDGCVKNYPESGSLTYCMTCAEGWTTIIGGCEEELTATPTNPTDPKLLQAHTSPAYTNFGVIITENNWHLDGTADTYTLYHNGVTDFWGNSAGTLFDGILNKCGVWSQTTVDDQNIGFSKCFDILVEKVYYIGIACDNYAFITLDGITIIQQDEVALNIWLSRTQADAICHKYWYIYPITLTSGQHIVEVIGHNNTGIATLGMEIYDIEPDVLMSYSSYAEMGTGLIFSSKDMVGESVQLGDNGQGYTCPSGYLFSNCGGVPLCYQIVQIPCPV